MDFFGNLPIGAKFRQEGERVYVKKSLTRASSDGGSYTVNPDRRVTPLEQNEWETYTIKIGYYAGSAGNDDELGDLTERFESELYRLVQKYSGQAGLIFDARDSVDRSIVEY